MFRSIEPYRNPPGKPPEESRFLPERFIRWIEVLRNLIKTIPIYQTGEFTVTFTSAGGSVTVNANNDNLAYTRIGQVVHVQGTVVISSVAAPTGQLTMGPLPFTPAALTELADSFEKPISMINATVALANYAIMTINSGSTSVSIDESDGTSPTTDITPKLQTVTAFSFDFSYITDD